MSFLLDPPLLVAAGAATEYVTSRERTADLLEGVVAATFVGVSSALYLNLPATRWIWKLCRAESGRDWMLNSGVFDFEHESPPARTHVVAAGIFATYPLWVRLGRELAAQRRSRTASRRWRETVEGTAAARAGAGG